MVNFINNDTEYDEAVIFLFDLDAMYRGDDRKLVSDMRMFVASAIDNYDEARG